MRSGGFVRKIKKFRSGKPTAERMYKQSVNYFLPPMEVAAK